MELSEGRPLDTEGRLEKEVRVYDLLDQLGITYWRTDHEAAGTMEDCNEIDRILDVLICKNLFLCNRQKTKFYMLMMPGDKPFKTKELSAQIHSARLSFAPEDPPPSGRQASKRRESAGCPCRPYGAPPAKIP